MPVTIILYKFCIFIFLLKSVIMVLLSLVSVLCGAHYLMLPFLLPSVFLPFLLLAVGRCVEVKVVGEVYTMHSTHCEGHGVNATKDARADGAGGVAPAGSCQAC